MAGTQVNTTPETWVRVETPTGLTWWANIDKYRVTMTFQKNPDKARLRIVVMNGNEICESFDTWLPHSFESARSVSLAMLEIANRHSRARNNQGHSL